jgi:hypothetical protein
VGKKKIEKGGQSFLKIALRSSDGGEWEIEKKIKDLALTR